ncbi:MAG: sigma-70 family RNA polymerase sigma factor [Candidatus Krumholzibacteria bacterium]|nr:sigma-70 family RNA polymerase sigma factor [Candidatus Krumholzibacteria bacterium]
MSYGVGEQFRDASDEDLVRRYLAAPDSPGGRAAASAVLGRYQNALYLWCFRYVRDHERALDLVQDTMMVAFEHMGGFAGRARFSSWLFAIARNRCLNAIRRVRLLDDGEDALDAVAEPGPSPHQSMVETEDEERILRLIRDELDPIEQRALSLRCFEQLPVDHITRMLGVEGETGARTVLQSARRKLRAAISREDQGHGGGRIR